MGLSDFNVITSNTADTSKFVSDMQIIIRAINKITSSYGDKYKVSRDGAGKYIADSVDLLSDLMFGMLFSSPTEFSNFFDAQQYYVGLSATINECLMSSNMANTFLVQTTSLEEQSTDIWTFYPEEYMIYGECLSKLSSYKTMLDNAIPLLTYMYQQVGDWLEQNKAKITTVNSDKLFGLNETNTNVTSVQGLWQLLNCSECISIIYSQIQPPIVQLGRDTAAQCLSQFEDAFKSNSKLASSMPQFTSYSTTSAFDTAKSELETASEQLSALIHAYLTANISGEQCTEQATKLLQDMSVDVQTIASELTASTNSWLTNVDTTQQAIQNLYQNVISDALYLAGSLKIENNTALLAALSKLQIFLNLRLVLQPKVQIAIGVRDPGSTIKHVLFQMSQEPPYNSYDGITIQNSLRELGVFVQTQVHQSVGVVQSLSNIWSDQRTSVDNDLAAFSDSLAVDDTFVR